MDVYSAVAGGVGALYGPLHGGANEAVLNMLERIRTVDAIPAFLAGVTTHVPSPEPPRKRRPVLPLPGVQPAPPGLQVNRDAPAAFASAAPSQAR